MPARKAALFLHVPPLPGATLKHARIVEPVPIADPPPVGEPADGLVQTRGERGVVRRDAKAADLDAFVDSPDDERAAMRAGGMTVADLASGKRVDLLGK